MIILKVKIMSMLVRTNEMTKALCVSEEHDTSQRHCISCSYNNTHWERFGFDVLFQTSNKLSTFRNDDVK